jgi:hypothetical protein
MHCLGEVDKLADEELRRALLSGNGHLLILRITPTGEVWRADSANRNFPLTELRA